MNFNLERFINYFKTPTEPEGIARKIGMELMQSVISLYKDPVFRKDGDVKNLIENSPTLILDLMSNYVAFTVLTLQSLAEFMENQELVEFYKEIAIEVKSFYSNYSKFQNANSENAIWYEKRVKTEIENFMISYETSKKTIKPLPENNYWVGLATYVCLVNLRQKKIADDDPLKMFLVKRMQKIENMFFKVTDEARRKKLENLASQVRGF